MPKKGTSKADGTLSQKELDTLKKATKNSTTPKALQKRSASMKATAALKKELGINGRLTPFVEDYLRNSLLAPDPKTGKPFLHLFIDNFLKEAKSNPGSIPGQRLAAAMFTPELLSQLDAEVNKQMAKDLEFITYRIRSTLYDKQQQVFDNNIDNTIEAICTRRAGKTEMLARLMLKDAMKPNHHILYVNRTFDNAVKQAGKPLTDLLDNLSIKYDGSPGGGMVKFDNGSDITFGGFYNSGEIDKFRGFKYSLVLVDEISHLRNPKMLVQEVLEPAMMDYGKEAQIIYTGTPPRIKKSYAYELWHNSNIKHYHWSFMDNPFIPDKEHVIESVCKKHGLTVDAPFIQREYFGNMEAFDTDAMIFKGYKTIKELPKNVVFDKAWIGVDWGFEDKAAVVSTVAKGQNLYVIDVWSEAKKSISEICNVIKEKLEELKKMPLAIEPSIICDTNEKSAVYELYMTYKIPNVYCAYKYDKDMAIEQLAEWGRTGTVSILDNGKTSALIEDFDNMVWKRDEDTDDITHEVDDELYHGNAAFALLYLSRQFAFESLGLTETNKEAKNIGDQV